MQNNIRTGALALIFPLIVLAGFAGHAAFRQNDGAVWQVRIAGYDPRDLLYGHYLVYRYDWNRAAQWNGEAGKAGEDCLCLNSSETGNRDPQAYPVHCGRVQAGQCASVIRAYGQEDNYFLSSEMSERHYIPEAEAAHLEQLLRDGKTELRIEFAARRGGDVAIRGLYVGDMELGDYLKERQ